MDIPLGFENNTIANKVCKLKKSLYGLKQSPRAWFDRFTRVLMRDSYVQCQADHTLFIKHATNGRITILIVCVNDIVLTGNHWEEIDCLKRLLAREFEIKDLGHLKYCLRMEVTRSSKVNSMSQCKYVLNLLKEFRNDGM